MRTWKTNLAAVALASLGCSTAAAQLTAQTDGPIELAWVAGHDHVAPASEIARAIARDAQRIYAVSLSVGSQPYSRLQVVARDASTGALLWKNNALANRYKPQDKTCGLLSFPEDQRLYIAHTASPYSPRGTLSVLDASTGQGVAQWHAAPATLDSGYQELGASPDGTRLYAAGGSMTIGSNSATITAFDRATGAVLWQRQHGSSAAGNSPSRLAVDPLGARVFMARADGLSAYDAANGAPLWSAFGADVVACDAAGTRVYTQFHSDLRVYDAASGTLLASGPDLGSIEDIAAVDGLGVLALSFGASGSELRAFTPQLAPLWTDVQAPTAETWYPGRIVVDGHGGAVWTGRMMLPEAPGSSGGLRVQKTELASGATLWSSGVDALGPTRFYGGVADPPTGDVWTACDFAAAGGAAGSDLALRRFDAATGAVLHASSDHIDGSLQQQIVGAVASPEAATLLVTSAAGAFAPQYRLDAFDLPAGKLRWSQSDVGSSLMHAGLGLAFAGAATTDSATLSALALSDGSLRWTRTWDHTYFAALVLGLDGATLYAQVSTPTPTGPAASEIIALDPATGATRWSHADALLVNGGSGIVGAAAPGDVLVAKVLSPVLGTRVERLRAADGTVAWQQSLSGQGAQPYFSVWKWATGPLGRTLALSASATPASGPAKPRVLWLRTSDGALQGDLPDIGQALALALSPDESRIAELVAGGTVRIAIRELATAALGAEFTVPGVAPSVLAWGADGEHVYLAGAGTAGQHTSAIVGASASSGAVLWSAVATGTYDAKLFGYHSYPPMPRLCVDAAARRLYAIHTLPQLATGFDVAITALDLPALVGSPAQLSLATGGTQYFDLTAGPAHAAELAFMLGSASGTSPGLSFGGVLLPLNPDAYFDFTLGHPSSAVLPGANGKLDAHGYRAAQFVLPAGSDPALAGLVAHHAYVVLDPTTLALELASNAIAVELVP